MNKEEYPLVSIVIPTYNQNAVFLKECIDSAINQTYPNIEVIVSNNWSNVTHVQEVIDKYSTDHRLVPVKPSSHLNMIDNFVFAADQATGKYLSFLSSDDLLEKNAIQMLFDGLSKNPDTKMAFGEVRYADALSLSLLYFARDFKLKEGNYTAKEFSPYYMLNYGVWMVGNLIEKEEYNKMGGIKTDKIIYNHDTTFLIKWLNLGNSIYYVNKLTATFRIWKDENEKADNNRDLKGLNDMIESYNLIMESKYLLEIVGYQNVLNKREKHLEEVTLFWSIKYIKNEVSQEDFILVKNQLKQNINTWKMEIYFLCCQPIFKYILKYTYNKIKR